MKEIKTYLCSKKNFQEKEIKNILAIPLNLGRTKHLGNSRLSIFIGALYGNDLSMKQNQFLPTQLKSDTLVKKICGTSPAPFAIKMILNFKISPFIVNLITK